jgi:short-subunit dehydrogenase
MTHVFLKGMVERKKGHVVTIASVAVFYFPIRWSVVYSTTKSASRAFMDCLQEQLRFDQHDAYIKTTCVLPTILNTSPTEGWKYL